MLLKLVSFAMAAVPIVLLLRAVFFRNKSFVSPRVRQFKRELDFAITVFIFLIVCASLYAVGRLIWA